MNQRWLVETDAGEEPVEADEVEITASGVLVFYRCATRREIERTLLLTYSPAAWRRCRLDPMR